MSTDGLLGGPMRYPCGHEWRMHGQYLMAAPCLICERARQLAKPTDPSVPIFADRDETTRDAPCGLEYLDR